MESAGSYYQPQSGWSQNDSESAPSANSAIPRPSKSTLNTGQMHLTESPAARNSWWDARRAKGTTSLSRGAKKNRKALRRCGK